MQIFYNSILVLRLLLLQSSIFFGVTKLKTFFFVGSFSYRLSAPRAMEKCKNRNQCIRRTWMDQNAQKLQWLINPGTPCFPFMYDFYILNILYQMYQKESIQQVRYVSLDFPRMFLNLILFLFCILYVLWLHERYMVIYIYIYVNVCLPQLLSSLLCRVLFGCSEKQLMNCQVE